MSLASQQDWEEVGLLEYMELVSSGVKRFKGLRKYVDTGSLETGRILDGVDVDFDSRPSRANMEAQVDDLLFAKMKGTEKVYIISNGDDKNIYSTGFSILRVKDKSKVLPRFLFYWLRSKHFQQWKDRESSGATQKAISERKLEKFTIRLPPISAQETLASDLAKLDHANRLRVQANELTRGLLRAYFLQMFGDPLANPKNWATKPLSEFGKVTTGNTPSRRVSANYGNYIEWLKSDNLGTPLIFASRGKEGLSKQGAQVGRLAPKGSVLVTCIAGSLTSIGNAAIIDRDVAFNQQINAIVPDKDTDSLFLYHLLVFCRKKIQDNSTKAMKKMISKTNFERISLISPSPKLQRKFGLIAKAAQIVIENQIASKDLMDGLFSQKLQSLSTGGHS